MIGRRNSLMFNHKFLVTSCMVTVLVFCCHDAYAQGGKSPEAFSPEGMAPKVDCLGVRNGTAVDVGCGCAKPAAGPCGCDLSIKDRGCGCGNLPAGPCGCDLSIQDLGCGCGNPAAGACGCDLSIKDLGCGCGKPAAGECGCDLSIKDLGCGCGKPVIGTDKNGNPICERQCKYVRGDIVDLGFSETKLESYDKIFKKTGEAAGLQCLQKMIDRAIQTCQSNGITSRKNGIKHHDDCLAWEFASYTMPDWNGKNQKVGAHSNGAVCTKLHLADMRWCPSGSKWGFGIAKGCKPCAAGYFYFEEDPNNPDMCKIVQPDPNTELCGTFSLNYWRSTPISLEWSAEEGSQVSFSRFPLDPRNSKLWHAWKGSEQLPLLVYNPSHDGRIQSAAQLFGPWTFGGQRFAALQTNQTAAQPWSNGYEALATLDENSNERIEGQELQMLGLWFDRNRNGAAEDGEVVPLTQTGVTELSYGPVKSDGRGDLFVEVGYLRSVDGKLIAGRSIDWATISAPSQADLLTEYFAPALDKQPPAAVEPERARPSEVQAAKTGEPENYVGGVWQWAAAGEDVQGARGRFVLKDDSDEVTGYSLLETAFRAPNSAQLKSYGTIFMLAGKKSQGADGRVRFSFSLSGSSPESTSEATLAPDLKTMEGQTTVRTGAGKGSKTLSYRWVAKRM